MAADLLKKFINGLSDHDSSEDIEDCDNISNHSEDVVELDVSPGSPLNSSAVSVDTCISRTSTPAPASPTSTTSSLCTTSSTPTRVNSLLNRLHRPTASELA